MLKLHAYIVAMEIYNSSLQARIFDLQVYKSVLQRRERRCKSLFSNLLCRFRQEAVWMNESGRRMGLCRHFHDGNRMQSRWPTR